MINCASIFKYNSIACKLWQWDDWFLFICSWRKLLTDHFHTKIRNSLVHRFALSELYGRHSSWLIHLLQSSSCLVQRLVCISRHRRWSHRPISLPYFGPHSSFLAFFWTRAQNHSQFDCWARLYLWQLLWIEKKTNRRKELIKSTEIVNLIAELKRARSASQRNPIPVTNGSNKRAILVS